MHAVEREGDVAASQASAPAELVNNLELMARMANWLDPLGKAR